MKRLHTACESTVTSDLHDDITSLRTSVRELSARHTGTPRECPEVREILETPRDDAVETKNVLLEKARNYLSVQKESLRSARTILIGNQEQWRHDMASEEDNPGCQSVLRAVKNILDAQTERLNEDLREVRAVDQFLDDAHELDDNDRWARKTDAIPGIYTRIRSILSDTKAPDETVARYFPENGDQELEPITDYQDVNVNKKLIDRWQNILFQENNQQNLGSPRTNAGRYTNQGIGTPRRKPSNLYSALSLYAIQRGHLRDVLRRHMAPMTHNRSVTPRLHTPRLAEERYTPRLTEERGYCTPRFTERRFWNPDNRPPIRPSSARPHYKRDDDAYFLY